jgi:hypothetical protein
MQVLINSPILKGDSLNSENSSLSRSQFFMSLHPIKVQYTAQNRSNILKTRGNITSQVHTSNDPSRFYACTGIYNDSLYVYGGTYSKMESFNDLWRFDLGTLTWEFVELNYSPDIRFTTAVIWEDEMVFTHGCNVRILDSFHRINLKSMFY